MCEFNHYYRIGNIKTGNNSARCRRSKIKTVFLHGYYSGNIMKIKHVLLIWLTAAALWACNDTIPGSPDPDDTASGELAGRTVLIYIAADNTLSSYGNESLENITKGATAEALAGNNLLVYKDCKYETPVLLRITPEGQETVIAYTEDENSGSPETLRSVIEETIKAYPAKSYGLILWSHGSNWFPSSMATTKAFGQDGSNWIELPELQRAIPDNTFDFLIFDACYMGGIEVAYALKNKADYLIASPAEVMGDSFPYRTCLPYLFTEPADLAAVCEDFYRYYNQSSCTIALVSLKKLDKLAETTHEIVKANFSKTDTVTLKTLQKYFRTPYYNMYDFDDYIGRIATPEAYTPFEAALNEAVLVKKATPSFLLSSYGFYITHFSGLSTFILHPTLNEAIVNEYKKTDWYKAVYE